VGRTGHGGGGMNLLARILTGLALPLVFTLLVLAFAWVQLDGPGAPWSWLLYLVIIALAAVPVVGFLRFADEARYEFWAYILAAAVACAPVATGLPGAHDYILHSRGRDIACRVTSMSSQSINDVDAYYYGLACDGGKPTEIVATGQSFE